MPMDETHVELIRDTIKQGFDLTNQKIDTMTASFHDHVEKDEQYWKTIDEQRAQLRLIKYLGGGGIGTAIGAWLYNTFLKH